MHVEGLPAFDLCLLEQHGTDGAMQMHSVSVSLSLSPSFLSSFPCLSFPWDSGARWHSERWRACGSRLPCSDGNTLPVTEQRRTGGKRDGDRRKEREKGCQGRAEEWVWHAHAPLRATCLYRNPPSFCSVPLSAVVLTLAARKLVNLCHITHKWGLGLGGIAEKMCFDIFHSYLMYISFVMI